jgi:hypothetical protein
LQTLATWCLLLAMRRTHLNALAITALSLAACRAVPAPEVPAPEPVPAPAARAAAPRPNNLATLLTEPEILALDPQAGRAPRSGAVVESELRAIQSLRDHMSRTSPDRASLTLRLAVDYLELARAQTDGAKADKTRAMAVDLYKSLLTESPSYSRADEARYQLGMEHLRAGDRNSSRKELLEIISSAPKSKYVPFAYYLFGAMFREEGKSDPSKLTLAQQSMAKAASYAESPIATLARESELALARQTGQASAVASADRPSPASPPPTTAPTASPVPAAVPSVALLAAAPQPAAYALIIGVERYRDVPAATGARTDAEKFAELAQRTLGLRESHIRLFTEDHATRTDIVSGLRWLKENVGPGGRVYFFFSGHGAPSPDASTYLLPYDGNPKDISGSGLAMSDVMKALGETKAKDVLAVVDSCFSGAGGRSVLPPGARPLMRVKEPTPIPHMALFTASQGDEISGAAPGENQGAFTKYLLQGLGTGAADINGDGQVSLQELHDWVSPRVASASKRDNREQHPKLVAGSGVGGMNDFIVEYGLPTK